MIKNLIEPIQMWLLSQGKCVGCGKSLHAAKRMPGKKKLTLAMCRCRRTYVYNKKHKTFRRAQLTEV